MSRSTTWKGIVLAGGKGTRLHPITRACSKQLLPVYDKPMIYYPLSTLVLGGIRDILVISTPQDFPSFQALLGDGSRVGINLSYAEQELPGGVAQAFLIGKEFIGSSPVCLVLGDNLFWGDMAFLRKAIQGNRGATVFGYPVVNPSRYGIVTFDNKGAVVSIEEKPAKPRSHFAIPGIYCCDGRVVGFAEQLNPSGRGELEITDVINMYLDAGDLDVPLMGRGMAWLDVGTPDSLLEAAAFVSAIEHRQGLKIGCLEEAAFRMGFIDDRRLDRLGKEEGGTEYGKYLLSIAAENTNG